MQGFKNANEAAKKLGKVKDKVWEPNQDNVEIYNELYEEYTCTSISFLIGKPPLRVISSTLSPASSNPSIIMRYSD